jgi:hypothetical protein
VQSQQKQDALACGQHKSRVTNADSDQQLGGIVSMACKRQIAIKAAAKKSRSSKTCLNIPSEDHYRSDLPDESPKCTPRGRGGANEMCVSSKGERARMLWQVGKPPRRMRKLGFKDGTLGRRNSSSWRKSYQRYVQVP